MCGIVGRVSSEPAGDPALLPAMRDALAHRGPDDAGVWWSADGRVGLAHRRLAILDLSPAGHQPMSDGSGTVWVVFNGEIYNFQELRQELEAAGVRFRSGSDTEVLVEAYRAWGVDCLTRLNGMFAFALYDSRERLLFAARDRAGEKPFYYRLSGDGLAFASELKALLADPALPRQVDEEALEFYLARGYVPGHLCLVRGVRKLPAAHALTYRPDSGRLDVWRYWDVPAFAPAPVEEDDLVNELERLLADSVRRQLVADVPVAILLSGGLDSSLVTALAARGSGRPVKTFTITFPGHGGYDEAPYARAVARHFGTDHTELAAEPADVELLPELARQYDEPLADSSLVPTFLVSRLIRRHATVALGGDGGDELFGGYVHYRTLQRQRLRWLPRPLRHLLAGAADRLPLGLPGRNYLLTTALNRAERFSRVTSFFDARNRRRLLAPAAAGGARFDGAPEKSLEALWQDADSMLRNGTTLDFRLHLPDDILTKVDRASMLVALEVRAPWLDYRIIELAFGRVPDHLRATPACGKVLTRRLAARLLPAGLDLERKQGFSLPLAAWLGGVWGSFVEGVLREADAHLFDRRMIERLLRGQRRGYSHAPRLFALTMFELWRRHYRVGLA
jgi:asparagine synthase (glutamine-hydrolysing)